MPQLYRRKGGGGKGKTGSAVGSKGAPVTVSGPTGRKTAVAYGLGGGTVSTIPSGQPFAGRTIGGGTRTEVYGGQTYGSGYPGNNFRGVGSYPGFPFTFWPVIWPVPNAGYGGIYLHNNQYGQPSNTSRPGGPLAQAQFTSPTSNSTFHVMSDNSTVTSLIGSITANCTLGSNTSTTPIPYSSQPLPEQAVQYYRTSSVVLTLDGYNDTAALSNNQTAPDVPLPSWVDLKTLNCLNSTIGQAVPLISDASMTIASLPAFGTLCLVWLMSLCAFRF